MTITTPTTDDIRYAPHLQTKLAYWENSVRDDGGNACFVFFHGGGWDLYDRYRFRFAGVNGYAWAYYLLNLAASDTIHWDFISCDYRMISYGSPSPTYSAQKQSYPSYFPDAFEDCDRAIQYVFDNASTFDVNPNRIFAGGVSAGSQMTMVNALRRSAPYMKTAWAPKRWMPKSSSAVRGILNTWGPIDCRVTDGVQQILWTSYQSLFGITSSTEFDAIPNHVLASASPLAYLESGVMDATPAGIYSVYYDTGSQSHTHPYTDPHDSQQGIDLHAKLVELGIASEYEETNWEDHVAGVPTAASQATSARAKAFLEGLL